MDVREQTYSEQQLNAGERLWRFATTVYASPGVAQACIRAQDEQGVDVNLMLYVSWCAQEALLLTVDDILLAQERCRRWRENVILPLRKQRLAWRQQESRATEYAAIKTLEIQAERTQLELLAGLSESLAMTCDLKDRSCAEAAALHYEHLKMLATHYRCGEDVFFPFLHAFNAIYSEARKPPD